jgi:hypothetical protein
MNERPIMNETTSTNHDEGERKLQAAMAALDRGDLDGARRAIEYATASLSPAQRAGLEQLERADQERGCRAHAELQQWLRDHGLSS